MDITSIEKEMHDRSVSLTMGSIAKEMMEKKTAFTQVIMRYRENYRLMLIESLKKAELYNCDVWYQYDEDEHGRPREIIGRLSVELCADSFDIASPYVVSFRSGRMIRFVFLANTDDYFRYLFKNVFPKLRKVEERSQA